MSEDTNAPAQNPISDQPQEPVVEVVAETPKTEDRNSWFRVGDTVVVNYKIPEGEKFRIQPFEGLVIGIKGCGISKSFTVRRIAASAVGVERIFPLYSPNIESVKVKQHGKIRRAKLYYMRDRIGKAASKVKEKVSIS